MSERDENAAEPTEMQEDESQAASVEAAGVESHQAVGDPGDEQSAERQPRGAATDPDGGGL